MTSYLVAGYNVPRDPTMPGFLNGSAVLFIRGGIPYASLSVRDLCSEDFNIVGAVLNFVKSA